MSRTPGDPTRHAPAFGEHTDEELREAGYTDEEISSMKESGAAAGPSADATTTFRA
jgi:crotonobetainyl-CoA:carnitine CoA-transferase CaiB-like acyl-CoA transferase